MDEGDHSVDLLDKAKRKKSEKLWETEFSEEAANALLASEPEDVQPEILECWKKLEPLTIAFLKKFLQPEDLSAVDFSEKKFSLFTGGLLGDNYAPGV